MLQKVGLSKKPASYHKTYDNNQRAGSRPPSQAFFVATSSQLNPSYVALGKSVPPIAQQQALTV